ncbi:cytochrome P450 2K1-like isoform X3 [Scyliorhinus torazame]|uniref:cytochrome P450 2K1-like isoform X3 n=1 Tax=Scyliorhinus torazame TaxID=75743 RepID=UPI003B5C5421
MSLLCFFGSDTVTLVLFSLLAGFCLLYFYIRPKPSAAFKLPPGPAPLPLIGNLHTLDLKMLYKSLMELSVQYGSVFTIQLGLEKVVVLTGYKTVKEALVDRADEFAERAKIPVLEMQTNGYGISFGHGESWKQMRRFTLMTLRDFGMGKKTIEDKITEEAKFLVHIIQSYQGQPFDTTEPVTSAMANIICSIVFGDRFDYKDQIFCTITKLIRENFHLLGTSKVQMYNAFPFLGFLPGTHKKIFENRTQMVQLILNFYKEHEKTLNENDIRSLIDAFLLKRQEESKNSDSHFHDNNLVTSVINLFAAGTDTSSSTLRWAILFLAKYPKIQSNPLLERHFRPGWQPRDPFCSGNMCGRTNQTHWWRRYIYSTQTRSTPTCHTQTADRGHGLSAGPAAQGAPHSHPLPGGICPPPRPVQE